MSLLKNIQVCYCARGKHGHIEYVHLYCYLSAENIHPLQSFSVKYLTLCYTFLLNLLNHFREIHIHTHIHTWDILCHSMFFLSF